MKNLRKVKKRSVETASPKMSQKDEIIITIDAKYYIYEANQLLENKEFCKKISSDPTESNKYT